MLSPGQIAPPIRHVVRRYENVRVELAEVTGFDLDRRVVHATVAAGLRDLEIPYDSLIVAAGVNQSYFGHDELARFAPGMKTIDDALELRRRIFGAFEMAAVTDDPDRAGEVAHRRHRRRWTDRSRARRTGARTGGALPRRASSARSTRRRCGCSCSTAGRSRSPRSVTGSPARRPKNCSASAWSCAWAPGWSVWTFRRRRRRRRRLESRIDAYTTIWAAGVQASPLAAMLAEASGAELDRAGRIAVLPDLTLPGHPEVFAVGDMADARHPAGRRRGRHAGRVACRQHDLATAQRQAAVDRSSTATWAALPRSGGSTPSPACTGCASVASPAGWCGSSCTWPSSTASATASRRCCAGCAR